MGGFVRGVRFVEQTWKQRYFVLSCVCARLIGVRLLYLGVERG